MSPGPPRSDAWQIGLDGYREQRPVRDREVLLDPRSFAGGLAIAPELASGRRRSSSFWKALREVYGDRRASSAVGCTRPVPGNVAATQLPKSVQPRAKQHLQDICLGRDQAVRRGEGLRLLPGSASWRYQVTTSTGSPLPGLSEASIVPTRLLTTSRLEHWKHHLRTTNGPLKAPLRPCASGPPRPQGCLSRMTALTMVFIAMPSRPASLPAKPGLGKTWLAATARRDHLPQAHQHSTFFSKANRHVPVRLGNFASANFCVQGNRLRLGEMFPAPR